MFTASQLHIIRFCAIECRMQRSGEESVYRMVQAYDYALEAVGLGHEIPRIDDVQRLGMVIEPIKNRTGWRTGPVWVDNQEKAPFTMVPLMMVELMEGIPGMAPDAFFLDFENIHPFNDGNGRTGQILFNWLSGTLYKPEWAPDFWGDDRRYPGHGAPDQETCS